MSNGTLVLTVLFNQKRVIKIIQRSSHPAKFYAQTPSLEPLHYDAK